MRRRTGATLMPPPGITLKRRCWSMVISLSEISLESWRVVGYRKGVTFFGASHGEKQP